MSSKNKNNKNSILLIKNNKLLNNFRIKLKNVRDNIRNQRKYVRI